MGRECHLQKRFGRDCMNYPEMRVEPVPVVFLVGFTKLRV